MQTHVRMVPFGLAAWNPPKGQNLGTTAIRQSCHCRSWVLYRSSNSFWQCVLRVPFPGWFVGKHIRWVFYVDTRTRFSSQHSAGASSEEKAEAALARYEADPAISCLPICMSKTQYSLSEAWQWVEGMSLLRAGRGKFVCTKNAMAQFEGKLR